jgi:hypothetical protein
MRIERLRAARIAGSTRTPIAPQPTARNTHENVSADRSASAHRPWRYLCGIGRRGSGRCTTALLSGARPVYGETGATKCERVLARTRISDGRSVGADRRDGVEINSRRLGGLQLPGRAPFPQPLQPHQASECCQVKSGCLTIVVVWASLAVLRWGTQPAIFCNLPRSHS